MCKILIYFTNRHPIFWKGTNYTQRTWCNLLSHAIACSIVHVVLHTVQICRTSVCTIIYNLIWSISVVSERDSILGTLRAPAFPSTSWQLFNHIWRHAFLHLYTPTIGTLRKSPQTFICVRINLIFHSVNIESLTHINNSQNAGMMIHKKLKHPPCST